MAARSHRGHIQQDLCHRLSEFQVLVSNLDAWQGPQILAKAEVGRKDKREWILWKITLVDIIHNILYPLLHSLGNALSLASAARARRSLSTLARISGVRPAMPSAAPDAPPSFRGPVGSRTFWFCCTGLG